MEHIDKIFVINLKDQPERLTQFYDEMEKINIPMDKIERFEGILELHTGCPKSHLQILKISRERGYKNVLIFEDDFYFTVSEESFKSKLKDFFEIQNIDWKVLMLSYNNVDNEIKPFRDSSVIGITNKCQTASGYLVNSNYFTEVIDCLEYGVLKLTETMSHWLYANDQIWKMLQKDDKWFYMLERCGKQRSCYRVDGTIVEYDC